MVWIDRPWKAPQFKMGWCTLVTVCEYGLSPFFWDSPRGEPSPERPDGIVIQVPGAIAWLSSERGQGIPRRHRTERAAFEVRFQAKFDSQTGRFSRYNG